MDPPEQNINIFKPTTTADHDLAQRERGLLSSRHTRRISTTLLSLSVAESQYISKRPREANDTLMPAEVMTSTPQKRKKINALPTPTASTSRSRLMTPQSMLPVVRFS